MRTRYTDPVSRSQTNSEHYSLAWKIKARTIFLLALLCLLGLRHGAEGSAFRNGGDGEGVVAESELGDGSAKGCIVVQREHLSSHKNHLLVFVTHEQSLTACVTFKDKDKDYYRDAVVLLNSKATHKKMRQEQDTSIESHILTDSVPEGWNTFNLEIFWESSPMLLMTTRKEEIPLLKLTMDYPIHEVLLIGNFSVCSGDSPEWLVNEGERVIVPLDLERTAELDVTGAGNAEAYLEFPENLSNLTLPANTSLTVITEGSDSGSIVEVVQDGKGRHYKGTQPESPPKVSMGGRRGTTRLRLKREVTQPPPASSQSPPASSQSPPTSLPLYISTVVLLALLLASNVALLLMVRYFVITHTKKRSKAETTQDQRSMEEVTKLSLLYDSSRGTTDYQDN